MDDWPWPLKIQTLGEFRIVRDGAPLLFSRRAGQKPLALLKAIIAYGGRDVSRQQLADNLWPEADGAQADQSFESALHRLRRLTGDKSILLNKGLVKLDMRRCWVDFFVFEQVVRQAEELFARTPEKIDVESLMRSMDIIVNLYGGHFLVQDVEQSWLIPARECTRAKFQSVISRGARQLEKAAQEEKAIEYLEKGLERDGAYEEFYQQLMICHYKLGRHAAAREAYRRSRTVLAALGTGLSDGTEEIYSRINTKICV